MIGHELKFSKHTDEHIFVKHSQKAANPEDILYHWQQKVTGMEEELQYLQV